MELEHTMIIWVKNDKPSSFIKQTFYDSVCPWSKWNSIFVLYSVQATICKALFIFLRVDLKLDQALGSLS